MCLRVGPPVLHPQNRASLEDSAAVITCKLSVSFKQSRNEFFRQLAERYRAAPSDAVVEIKIPMRVKRIQLSVRQQREGEAGAAYQEAAGEPLIQWVYHPTKSMNADLPVAGSASFSLFQKGCICEIN